MEAAYCNQTVEEGDTLYVDYEVEDDDEDDDDDADMQNVILGLTYLPKKIA